MIDAKTEVSTRELCEIADLTKGRLSQLENAGIIRRSGRDRWRLVERR
jgi:phage terminase Nu1 subunit (DNA packaging protein)